MELRRKLISDIAKYVTWKTIKPNYKHLFLFIVLFNDIITCLELVVSYTVELLNTKS